MPQAQFGRITALEDFNGSEDDTTWGASVDVPVGNGSWWIVSVQEGTIQKVLDEPGGVIQFLTDTADNDNVALISGPYRPADGGVVMEAYFKVADDMLNTALFLGFSETLDGSTPVMPAEFATESMTYNGSGGMVGFNYDSDASDNDFRALAGDGGGVSSNADANGTRANQGIASDEYYRVRVELDPDGTARMWMSHDGEGKDGMFLVKEIVKAVTPGDVFFAVVMCENRTGAALEFEVDLVYAEGHRDWSV